MMLVVYIAQSKDKRKGSKDFIKMKRYKKDG